MKILNKKGFILVETLIVTVFVMTIFLVIYKNTLPYVGEYEKLETYDDIDSVYAANMIKQALLKYGNFDYISANLTDDKPYLEIQDCENTNIFESSDYCKKLKSNLEIEEDDYIFLTKYNLSKFREVVDNEEKFDSGKLSNFRDYLNTVFDKDPFYDEATATLMGNYRIFITRSVSNQDNTKTLKFANLGIYTGKNKRYDMGDLVEFNPGDGTTRKFYVFKNSPTTEDTVMLIPESNLTTLAYNSVCQPMDLEHLIFDSSNCYQTASANINNYLNSLKSSWKNVNSIRLIKPSDFKDVINCNDETNCFDISSLVSTSLDENTSYLSSNLTSNTGYWIDSYVTNGKYEMYWTIQNGKITPAFVNKEYGVRPIVIVNKSKLEV